jgi:hypothetical protein
MYLLDPYQTDPQCQKLQLELFERNVFVLF